MDNTLTKFIQIIFYSFLILLNVAGIIYCINIYSQATDQASKQNSAPIGSKLVNPLNTRLYISIQQSRANRTLYSSGNNPTKFSEKEIF